MFAIPVHKATGIDTNTLILVSGLLMTATVYFGISALMVLSAIAVPAIALLGGYSVIEAVNSVGGISELQQVQPTEPLDFSNSSRDGCRLFCQCWYINGGFRTLW
ncbi:Cytosine permease [Vibrio alginolyticus 40B]|nr:Cytosine permease [Vibrio alginolyticus 40B]